MPKGKAINWTDADLEKLSEIDATDISNAQAWATPELQDLLTAQPDDELNNGNPEG